MASPFAKGTFGPPVPGTTDTNKHALIADIQNAVAEMVDDSGNTHGLETMLLLLQAQTALSTVTTAQNLINQTLNKGALNKTNRTLRISGFGIFTTTNAAQLTLALSVGGVALVSIQNPSNTAASITGGQFQFEFLVSVATTGASGTLEAHGSMNLQTNGTLTTALPQYNDQNTAVSSAVNLTAANAVLLTVAATAAVSSIQLRQATIEVIN